MVQSETGKKNMLRRTWTLGGLKLNMKQAFVLNTTRTLTLTWKTQEHPGGAGSWHKNCQGAQLQSQISTHDASWALMMDHEYSWCIMNTHGASRVLMMHHEYSWWVLMMYHGARYYVFGAMWVSCMPPDVNKLPVLMEHWMTSHLINK